MATTFDLENARITINGQNVRGLTGDAIKISFENDIYERQTGTHGETVRHKKIGSEIPMVELTSIEGGSLNSILAALYNADIESNNGIAQFSFNSLNGEFELEVQAWVKHLPEMTFSAESPQARVWQLDCEYPTILVINQANRTIPGNIINPIS